MGISLVALLMAGAVVNFVVGGDDDDDGRRSRPRAYRILYRVEQRIDRERVTWEERVVERPFRGRSATYDRRPGRGARPSTGNLTSAVALYLLQADGRVQEIAERIPAAGAGDHALGVVIDDAVDRGLARRLGRRSVLDRSCTTYRLAGPPTGPLQALEGGDHDDVCIDDAGLLLHEAWTLDGRVVLVRTAVELDLDPPADVLRRALSTAGAEPAAAELAVPRVEVVPPEQAVDSFLAAPPTPSGFTPALVLHHAVPAAVLDPSALDRAAIAYRAAAWVFTRGPDLLTVEAIDGPPGRPPWPADPSVPVRVEQLGPAESVLGPDGAELRVEVGEGRWVRVRGTLPLADVADYADGVRRPRP